MTREKMENILEVNCGTGEDAFFMNRMGCKVVATDISSEMINLARAKKESTIYSNIFFDQLDVREMGRHFQGCHFNMIFSNFGGLNCITESELRHFFESSHAILKHRGRVVMILMAKNCLWEKIFFAMKGKKDRRNTNQEVTAEVGGKEFKVWYYSLKDIRKLSDDLFTVRRVRPIGFFVPPSYLNRRFENTGWLRLLTKLDQTVKGFSFLADHADHIFIELEKK